MTPPLVVWTRCRACRAWYPWARTCLCRQPQRWWRGITGVGWLLVGVAGVLGWGALLWAGGAVLQALSGR